ncbi:PREDICTED: mitochondrial inner membrane protease subunit 2 [Nanorana parkeri]|uniref:mitochondrial inner membrane protease subunit 2 n=1 Tax=Nanorana parkeri TaxID=125878 RepID=UPI000854C8B0|nr:PREDICTED: mitochondrial inner membrane protease subunit 2 [Nanorana parkeri]
MSCQWRVSGAVGLDHERLLQLVCVDVVIGLENFIWSLGDGGGMVKTARGLSPRGDVVMSCQWRGKHYHSKLQRGTQDILATVSPKNPEQKIIKRVIGLEGDIVKSAGHKTKFVKIPNGHLWVEGDHRGHSFDSNAFGPVSLGLLHAQATHILWPPQRWQKLKPVLPEERKPVYIDDD